MATKESDPKDMKEPPPSIATKQSSPSDEHKVDIRQARTPKHANISKGGDDEEQQREQQPQIPYPTQDFRQPPPPPHAHQQQHQHHQQQHGGAHGPGYQYPPRDYCYEQRPVATSTAPFSPRQQQQQQQQQHPYYQRRGGGARDQHNMATVSPGNDYRQYYGGSRGDAEYQQQRNYGRPYDSRYSSGGGSRAPPPPPDNRFVDYGNYQQQQQPPSGGGYQQGGYRGTFNTPDSRYNSSGYAARGRPSYPPREYVRGQTPDGRYPPADGGVAPFSRAVSSSFDRSVKSRNGEPDGKAGPNQLQQRQEVPPPAPADTSIAPSDDSSWRQLKQVTSIDETELQKRLLEKKVDDKGRNIHVNQQPNSTSSSLTNSPHDGKVHHDDVKLVDKAPLPTPSKLAALDSLSSVASGQEPLVEEAKKVEAGCPPSPGSSPGSLDLMKCHSGSSGLLHSFHQRGLSSTSLMDYTKLESKRSREERVDMDTSNKEEGGEVRRTQSATGTKDDQPPIKKSRRNSDAGDIQQSVNKRVGKSPLGIDCSPSNSPPGEKKKEMPTKPGRSDYNTSPGPSYFDHAPSYTYSIDSKHSFPRDRSHLPGRPASSSSSTITPMERTSEVQEGVGPSLPSWDLQQQDSFGNVSSTGPLMSNFSFSQDYPGLGVSSGSNLGYGEGRRGEQHSRSHVHPGMPAESRNQSFDGGHYHGDFNRSNSIEQGYAGNPPPRQGGPRHPPPSYPQHDGYKKHAGSFPPHAPSWGTTTSTGSHHAPPPNKWGPPPPPNYGNYRGGPPGAPYGMVNRNYSEDSRTSPPPPRIPPPGVPPPQPPRGGGFQPPPDFAAPHNPHLVRRPPPAVYIMSSSNQDEQGASKQVASSGAGVYSWSKDDDTKLTEVMKKYKNPRDWNPIAKEHGRGKSSKECHERWIRYLKPGVRKGQWQDHEDAIVVEAVTTSTEQPFTRWSDLAQRLPGRVGKQIRDRWVNHLNPNINHLPFSREDDLLLWDGHKKLGKRWVEISTKYFENSRSENHIKNRWYSASFKKFIANEFGSDAYSGGAKSGGGSKKDKKGKKEIKTQIMESV